MKSEICEFIKGMPANKIINVFAEKDVKVKVKDNLAIFNYDIAPDFTDPLVQESRGIIIDLNTYSVVCWPFRKFGNYGESYADSIDWDSARVQEKVDGSIMKLYYYNNKWNLATNGTIDAYKARGNYINSNKSFGEIFDEGAADAGLDYSKLDKDYTYIFELVSPELPIVLNYDKTTIYHLGTRNNKTGEEVNVDIGVKKPKEYHLNSLEECIAAAKMINADRDVEHLIGEGYVVVDKNWHRIKIKSPAYLQVHYFKAYSNPTDRRILAIIRLGEVEEVCTYFPPFREKANRVQAGIDRVFKSIYDYVISCEDEVKILDRKTFFMKHKADRWIGITTNWYYEPRNDETASVTLEQYINRHLSLMRMTELIKLYNTI